MSIEWDRWVKDKYSPYIIQKQEIQTLEGDELCCLFTGNYYLWFTETIYWWKLSMSPCSVTQPVKKYGWQFPTQSIPFINWWTRITQKAMVPFSITLVVQMLLEKNCILVIFHLLHSAAYFYWNHLESNTFPTLLTFRYLKLLEMFSDFLSSWPKYLIILLLFVLSYFLALE